MAFGMQTLARGWLVLRISNDSPLALSMVIAAYTLPATFMSLIGGALADRIPKKYILFFSQAINILVTGILATLDFADLISFWQIIILSVISGSMDAVNLPSRTTIISELVPKENLLNAVSLSNASTNLTRIVGPALAGILILIIDTAGVFYFISGCYLLSVLCVYRVSLATIPSRGESKSIIGDITRGLKYAAAEPTILGLLIIVIMHLFFGFSIQALLPAWAREALDVQSQGLGALMMSMGAGALTGTLILAALKNLKKRGSWILLTAIVWGVAMAVFSGSESYITALPLIYLIGVCNAIHTSLHMTLMQVYSSPEMRGRMMSLVVMSFGLTPVSALPFGVIAEKIGTPNTLCISGILLCLTVITFGILYPRFRNIE
jgi:predicted MFS family arabinose efflux permease